LAGRFAAPVVVLVVVVVVDECDWFINKFQLAHIDLMSCSPIPEATNAITTLRLAGLVDEQFADVAKFLILLVITLALLSLTHAIHHRTWVASLVW